ncbi:Peptide methionine sulfoxide reductase MsrA [Neolewinella maritima]|uniref:peptide-methionine (S)-S-oxide reductase n=1 Tax=Neolewinella maritima TaxID=1383882 RepID=A0ABN8F2T7_9BACT|nr:peptide-methionine (S)-S-oxide reductase MsrA [Neolewinella maritima]CAH1001293.1 Peptide methionine sulfoxide reductase MsrA [Neolewinella maritima]
MPTTNVILLGAGCFWSKEYHLGRLPGVTRTRVGFAGGTAVDPSYVQVCHKDTGHAEVVEVTYDAEVLSTEALLTEFFTLHNFKINRGRGVGQYRSAVFSLEEDDQLATARRMLEVLAAARFQPETDVEAVAAFYPAEARHQGYCDAHGMAPDRKQNDRVRELLQPATKVG